MTEYFEFRFDEEFASQHLPETFGTRLRDSLGDDSVRKVTVTRDSAQFRIIESLARRYGPDAAFLSWNIERTYSRMELTNAWLLAVRIKRVFEPSGEECGSKYDLSPSCEYCGGGIRLASELFLDLRKVPRSSDLARSLADEWIVSQRLAEIIIDKKVSGCKLHRIQHKTHLNDDSIDFRKVPAGRRLLEAARAQSLDDWQTTIWMGKEAQRALTEEAIKQYRSLRAKKLQKWSPPASWYRLEVTSQPLSIEQSTRTGVEPFTSDADCNYICRYAGKFGHSLGLNRLSEVHVINAWDGSDMCCTGQLIGWRMGVLRPAPVLIISQRFRRILEDSKVGGYKLEIVHMHSV